MITELESESTELILELCGKSVSRCWVRILRRPRCLKYSNLILNLISFKGLFLWLICTLAVRFFQTALNAHLKIKSVGFFSVQGVSIQFHPQHTLVGHAFVYMTFM
uniref:Uncharacterized protein n=1 Tax=Neolamprologus brichardi TaxID=32507 RepID=A0A3Q4N3Z0_NEOBR